MTPSSPSVLTRFFLVATGLLLFTLDTANAKVASSITDDLRFDENQKLATNYIVYPANREDCPTRSFDDDTMDPGEGYENVALEGDALARVFPLYDPGDGKCVAACLEKGTDITLAGVTMPHLHYDGVSGESARQSARFGTFYSNSCRKVEVCMINYVTRFRTLNVDWIHPTTRERFPQYKLKSGERHTKCFFSFIGHEFYIWDEESDFKEILLVENITTKSFGTAPPSSSQKFDGIKEVENTVRRALNTEWSKHKKVARTFSSLGFAKGRLPDDVFANMGAFYYNNRNNVVHEEWEGKGVFVNWWESNIKFVSIPWNLKERWQLRLMDLVSAWAGVEVEQTSMYGLRQYETGARLLSHVDRLPTHAVSLIVNIAQDNLAEPWPVEVFDHADRLHEITMEAGDIVYYESAKNLHSRNRPLTCREGGCSYVNLFTHYRPVEDGDKWHSNLSDMPNRPPPLTIGQVDYDHNSSGCRVPETGEKNTDERGLQNVIGVGTVECDDERLGAFVSPTLFKARSAGDLLRWWKASSDSKFSGFSEKEERNDYISVKEYLRGDDDDDDDIPHDGDDDDMNDEL